MKNGIAFRWLQNGLFLSIYKSARNDISKTSRSLNTHCYRRRPFWEGQIGLRQGQLATKRPKLPSFSLKLFTGQQMLRLRLRDALRNDKVALSGD